MTRRPWTVRDWVGLALTLLTVAALFALMLWLYTHAVLYEAPPQE